MNRREQEALIILRGLYSDNIPKSNVKTMEQGTLVELKEGPSLTARAVVLPAGAFKEAWKVKLIEGLRRSSQSSRPVLSKDWGPAMMSELIRAAKMASVSRLLIPLNIARSLPRGSTTLNQMGFRSLKSGSFVYEF